VGKPNAVTTLAFNPEGTQIVSGAQDGTVRVWDLNTQKGIDLLRTVPATISRRITSVAFSDDGSLIVSGGADGAVRLWDAHTRKPFSPMFARHEVWSVAISPDGRQIASASGGTDGSIQLWDVATRTAVGPPMVVHPGASIHSIDFSADGKRIVSGSHDGYIRVTDVESRQPLAGHPMILDANPVLSVAFAHHHRWIVSSSSNGAIRVWDAESHNLIGATFMENKNDVPSVAIDEDDGRILSGSIDGEIQLWPTPEDLTQKLCDKLSADLSRSQLNDGVFDKINCSNLAPSHESLPVPVSLASGMPTYAHG
jgi:WD40 repeat protein